MTETQTPPPSSDDYLAEVISVKVADCFVDHRYQRSVKKSSVTQLIKNWSWRRYFPIIVAHRGGQGDRYAIIDGQQRFMAAQELNIDKLPAILVVCRDLETEAEMFVGVNTGAAVGAGDRFKADFLRGTERAKTIAAVVNQAGFFLSPLRDVEGKKGPAEFTISAIGSLERVYDQGYLYRVLKVIGDSFGSSPARDMTSGNFLEGVYLAMRHLDRFETGDEALIKALSGTTVAELLDRGYERYKSMVTSRSIPGGIAAVVIERFNYRKKASDTVPPYDRSAVRAMRAETLAKSFDPEVSRANLAKARANMTPEQLAESARAGGRASAAKMAAAGVRGRFRRVK